MKKLLNKEEKRQLVLDNVVKKSGRFYRLFTSPIGAEVLKDLEDEFNKDDIFREGMPDATAHMLGKRDVIIYIHQMIRLKQNANRAEEN